MSDETVAALDTLSGDAVPRKQSVVSSRAQDGSQAAHMRLVAGSVYAVNVSTEASYPDDPQRFVLRLQAEVQAEAELRRRGDPALRRAEREIERAWAGIAPPGVTGAPQEILLDRAERLSLIDVDAPVGTRPGTRHVKSGIRKAGYWYLRYVADQLNALHYVLTRVLRNFDERVSRLERVVDLEAMAARLANPVPAPAPTVVAAVVGALDGRRHVLVVPCAEGSIVEGLDLAGIPAHGIESDATLVADGVRRGLDLRVEQPLGHLRQLQPNSVDAVVLTGQVELCTLAGAIDFVEAAVAAVGSGGRVVVGVAHPMTRSEVERELLQQLGLSPHAWAELLRRNGTRVHEIQVDDNRIGILIVADIA